MARITIRELIETLSHFPGDWEVENAAGKPIDLSFKYEIYIDALKQRAILTPTGLVIK